MNNIFIHDAVPTWSGFLYQGQIAVYLAVKTICKLRDSGKMLDIEKYAIEMERCEDIAVIYEDKKGKIYQSIHQVKNQADKSIQKYKGPLTQLMLEKGFCIKNSYGIPEAYLHVSNQIKINDGKNFEEKIGEWKTEIIEFYENLCCLCKELNAGLNVNETLKKLEESVSEKKIDINREKYAEVLSKIKKACEKKDELQASRGLNELLTFLEEEFCVPEISEKVKIYGYENGEEYCSGTDVFSKIVGYVKKYKENKVCLSKDQYEYIADRMLRFVQDKILERHKLMQEKKEASWSIPLNKFSELLDGSIEKYEEEANVLALIRMYDERLEQYCSICHEGDSCQKENCKLQLPNYRRNTLEREDFIKFCYNLNPECAKNIRDRTCLGDLLTMDGMVESVFTSIKEIPEKDFIKKADKTHFEVMNHEKVAFITAISNRFPDLTVNNIIKAMETNQDLIETIFDADQLVTTRLDASPSVWENSCVRIRSSDLHKGEIKDNDYEEHSIFAAKKPQFIKAEQLIESVGK